MSSAIAPIRTAGIATGLALAALMVLAFRVPASSQSLGAGVRFEAVAPGEVHVPRTGAFLKVGGLKPGGRSARADASGDERHARSGGRAPAGARGQP